LKRLYEEAVMPERISHQPLDNKRAQAANAEIHLLVDQCKGCGYCIRFCPKKILEESQEINAAGVRPPKVVDENLCIICTFCSAVCPDFAIFVTSKQLDEDKKNE
jgi:2-oxoglutarate ferredoxin oxidoreductase subunit delta